MSAHLDVFNFFRTMFQSGRWIESQRGYSLKLPVPGRLLSVLLDYIYTDDINLKKGTNDEPEFFCSLIVMADQFLVPRLIQARLSRFSAYVLDEG